MAKRDLFQVPTLGDNAEPTVIPSRGQRGVREPQSGREVPQLLEVDRAPAGGVPLRPVRASPRRTPRH